MKLLTTGGRILATRLGQVVVNAAIGLLVARSLEPAGLGYYSLTIAVIMFVAAVLNGGMGLAAVPLLRQGRVRLQRMLQAQGLWIILAVGGILLLGFGADRVGLAALTNSHLGWSHWVAIATGVGVVALLAFDIYFYDLLAEGRLVTGPVVNFLRALLHLLLLVLILLFVGLNLTGAVASFASAQLLAAMSVAWILWRRSRRIDPPRAKATTESAPPPREHNGDVTPVVGLVGLVGFVLRRGWIGQVSAVASLLHLRLDLALVSGFCGAATVGIYSAAVIVGELLWHLPAALSLILVYSSAGAEQPERRDRDAARAVRVGLLITGAVAVPLALVAGPLLKLVFGDAYLASAPALRALLPGIVAFAPGAILAGDFIGRGRPVWNAQASGVTVAVNVICGLWLIPAFGAVGASWASSIAYAIGAGVMVARFHRVSGLSLRTILVATPADFR